MLRIRIISKTAAHYWDALRFDFYSGEGAVVMHIHEDNDMHTSGQLGPKHGNTAKNQESKQFLIDGCSVSFSSADKGSDEVMKIVKEILLTTYRAKTAKG